MAGGWKSNSECGPELPQDFGGDADHGAARLVKVMEKLPQYTKGEFLGPTDYNVDRKNVDQATPGGTSGASDQTGGKVGS